MERKFIETYSIGKLIVIGYCSLYFLGCALRPGTWHFIDGVDLAIHEGGHVVFGFMGEFIAMAGGSIMQILMPVLFAVYFYKKEQWFSSIVVLFWIGQSFLNLSVYVGDAVAMRLPLVGGGGDPIHDWNYLLTRLHLLSATPILSFLVRLIGTLLIIAAIVLGVRKSKYPDERFADSP